MEQHYPPTLCRLIAQTLTNLPRSAHIGRSQLDLAEMKSYSDIIEAELVPR